MTPVSTSGRRRFELLSAQARRRLTALTLLRSFVNFDMMIMLYALSPLHGSGGARTLLYFLLGVALFVSILFWQLQRIARADHPQLVALQAVGLAIALILTVFAVVYILMSNSNPAAFSEDLTKSSSLYLAVTVLVIDLVLLGVIARVLFSAAQNAGARQRAAPAAEAVADAATADPAPAPRSD